MEIQSAEDLGQDSADAQSNASDSERGEVRWSADIARIVWAVYNCAPANRLPLIEATFDHLRAGAPAFATDWDAMDWARRWAEIASRAERKAYALACFEALDRQDQEAFLAYVGGRAAA